MYAARLAYHRLWKGVVAVAAEEKPTQVLREATHIFMGIEEIDTVHARTVEVTSVAV